VARCGHKCRYDAGGAPAPIVSGENRPFQPERVHKIREIVSECRLLTRSRRTGIEKPGRTVPAKVRHQHARAARREGRRDPVISVYVVGKTMQQNDRPARYRAALFVSDLERRGAEPLHGAASRNADRS
jgi:hypothetical protein